jgi:leader peptidase (prepilin peptidase)/N-methyltransferase
MAIFIKESFTLFSVVYIVFFSSLLIVSVIDIKTKEINLIHLILPGITLMTGLLLQEFKVISPDLSGTPYVVLKTALFGAAVGGLFIFLVRFFGGRILKQEAMGEGDIYIAILMGLAVGYRILFYAMIFAGVFGLIAFIAIPIIKKDKEIPFAPFLSMGLFTVFMLEEIFRRFNLI